MSLAAALAAAVLTDRGGSRSRDRLRLGATIDLLLPNVITLQPAGFIVTTAHGRRLLRLSAPRPAHGIEPYHDAHRQRLRSAGDGVVPEVEPC